MNRPSIALAVALVSSGMLAYEILLVRVFAIEYFHHFAYLAVGVAMLGLGGSGTVMTLVSGTTPRHLARWFAWSAALSPLVLVLSPALVHRIPLDPTQLAWDPAQWPLLGLTELVLALPFGVGGLVILLALAAETSRPGRIYAASFLGAGAGAAAAIGVLFVLSPERALALPALLAALGAMGAAFALRGRSIATYTCWASLPLAVLAVAFPPWQIVVTPYKGLPQVAAYPQARRVTESASPVGWLVEVDAPAFRHAPGLSLAFHGAFPRQRALFVDGQLAGAISTWPHESDLRAFVDYMPTASPYALGGRNRVLVIGAGDGLEVSNAIAHGAGKVTALELHAAQARRVREQRTVTDAAPVHWVVTDARGYLARTKERSDLITIGAGGAFGTAAAGVHSLDEDFLHTIDAYELYLGRLTDDGILSVTRWLAGPPREPVRVILTACEALRRSEPDALPRAMIVVRSWATVTILVKPSGFSQEQVALFQTWAADRHFDLDWYPGLKDPPPPGFNILEAPILYGAARSGVSGPDSAAAFASQYPFLVSPVPDSRPYTHHFLRLNSLGTLFHSGRAAWLPFAEWGLVALLATLVVSVALAALLLLGPVLVRAPRGGSAGRARLIAYFAAIGFAYLAAEIAAIQQLSLLLGHPVYAVGATLAGLLIGSGMGSAWSDRLSARRATVALAGLVFLLAAEAFLLLSAARSVQSAPLLVRSTVALLALVPPAFLMGFPFPLGLRSLALERPSRVAWAWAANGFASVVAAPLAALIALGWGSQVLFLSAAGGYASALFLLVGARPAGFRGRSGAPRGETSYA